MISNKAGAHAKKHFQSVTTDESRARRAPATAGGALARVSKRAPHALLLTLPAILFFSYQPIIPLGETSSMHLELSLPLLWIAVIALLSLFRLPKLIKNVKKPIILALAIIPSYATISLLWSNNFLRTLLTTGILWCIALTILSLIDYLKTVKKSEKRAFFTQTAQIFLSTAVLVSIFAWLQCIFDVAGVSREYTLLCEGCTYNRFGFPHPNAFAIEPQFFGNLLIAPVLLIYYSLLENKVKKSQVKFAWGIALFLTTTLFFSFSRGAIYSFSLATAFLIIYHLIKHHKEYLKLIPVVIVSFVLSLTAQGLFAQVSPTNDTFITGITKSLHHLTLGRLDLRATADSAEVTTEDRVGSGGEIAITSAQKHAEVTTEHKSASPVTTGASDSVSSRSNSNLDDANNSIFSGYVSESTTTRLDLNSIALDLWNDSPKTILIGTGLGGAGKTAYEKYDSLGTEQQIIQNEYLSLLLEFGIVGIAVVIIAAIIIAKITKFYRYPALVALLLAYAFSLLFFSGLPNALHIYLLPAFFFLAKDDTSVENVI